MPKRNRQHYVIAYDVTDDGKRTKLASLLLGYGERVQKSVFEADLEATRGAFLKSGSLRLVRRSGDNHFPDTFFSPQGAIWEAVGESLRDDMPKEAPMIPDPDPQALIDQSVLRSRKILEEKLPDDNAPLDQIEQAIEEMSKEGLPPLQEEITNKRAKACRDNQVTCPGGAQARYPSMGTRTLITRHDRLRWRRPTDSCRGCGNGSAPLDASLGLDQSDTTFAERDLVAFIAPVASLVETKQALAKTRGIDLSASTGERIAVSVGTPWPEAQIAEAALPPADQWPDRRRACPGRL